MSTEISRRAVLRTRQRQQCRCRWQPPGAAVLSETAAAPRPGWVAGAWSARPFALDQVALGDGVFRQKGDRILRFLRNYPGTGNVLDGPNRMLVCFRLNARLDTGGYAAPGGWDTPAAVKRPPGA